MPGQPTGTLSDAQMSALASLDPETIQRLGDVAEKTKGQSRRQFLAMLGAVGVGGGGIAYGAREATAQPDGSPGVIGQQNDRLDLWADQIGANSVDTDNLQGVDYASNYSGSDLSQRVSNALSSVDIVRVAAQSSAYTWGSSVSMDQGQQLRFDDPQQDVDVDFGSQTATALSLYRDNTVRGGFWESVRDIFTNGWDTTDSWTCFEFRDGSRRSEINVHQVDEFEVAFGIRASNNFISFPNIEAKVVSECRRIIEVDSGTTEINEPHVEIENGVVSSGTADGSETAVYANGADFNDGEWINCSFENNGNSSGDMLDFRGGCNGHQFFGLRTEGWNFTYRSNANTGQNYIYGVNAWDTNRHDFNDPSDFQFFGRKNEYGARINGLELDLQASPFARTEDTFNIHVEETDGVSTSATVIADTVEMGEMIVYGAEDGDKTNAFVDRAALAWNNVGDSNLVERGTPAGRTYSANGNDLELAMGSGTYNVVVKISRVSPDQIA